MTTITEFVYYCFKGLRQYEKNFVEIKFFILETTVYFS